MRVKTYTFSSNFLELPPLHMAGGRKVSSNRICPVCCICQKFLDPLACRTIGRRDHNCAASARPESDAGDRYL